ncbi:hypothetical protein FA95DRAFT_1416043 [Auriscalpium vulgare]|uniref:Uncharacterized protein n=1 Tax=Auriscalpium vulgare TaxID=40419 RepID=A0ACB8RPZ7_9AGAM|nr:hypothetical protein FA95DRAFT_1416043 [Auriscalpium vulgare]
MPASWDTAFRLDSALSAARVSRPTMPWPRMASRSRGRIKLSSDAAVLAIEALKESADAFPPLKSLTGGLSFLLTLSRTVKSNKDDAQCIADRVDQISALLEYTIPDATNISPPIKLAIHAFDQSLQRINEQLHDVCTASRAVRFLRVRKDEGRIKTIHQQLDDSIGNFTMSVSIQTKLQLDVVHADIDVVHADISRLQVCVNKLPEAGIGDPAFTTACLRSA